MKEETVEEYHFRGQQPHERVEMAFRQHPFTLIEHAFKSLVVFLFAVLLYRLVGFNSWSTILIVLFLVLSLLVAFRSWFGWWNTMMLLTNERVLFVEQKGFTSRKMSEALLQNIQFVTNEVQGIIHTLFNFGDVKIQTAGATETLMLKELADPYEIQQRITQLRSKKSERSVTSLPLS